MYSNQTKNYALPQFIGTDYMDIVADFNPAFQTIDKTMHDNEIKINGAAETANNAAEVAMGANETAQDADATAKALEAEVVALKQFESDSKAAINNANGNVPIEIDTIPAGTALPYNITFPQIEIGDKVALVVHGYSVGELTIYGKSNAGYMYTYSAQSEGYYFLLNGNVATLNGEKNLVPMSTSAGTVKVLLIKPIGKI